MRLPKILFVVFSMFLCQYAIGQYYYYNNNYYDRDLLFEVGAGIGGMNCITDIGGSKSKGGMYINDINFKYTQLSGSFYVGVLYQRLVGVRLEATWGSVKGADSILEGAGSHSVLERYERNLNFRSSINEIALLAEFHPLTLFEKEEPFALSPYVVAGVGYFRFNPQINLNGRYIDLKPLRTEGQGFPEYKGLETYSNKQVNVPVGIGIKYELSQMFSVKLEALHRFLFTDYLDDVSGTYIDPQLFNKNLSPMLAAQANAVYGLKKETPPIPGNRRGNPKSKDAYMTLSLKIGVTLGRERR